VFQDTTFYDTCLNYWKKKRLHQSRLMREQAVEGVLKCVMVNMISCSYSNSSHEAHSPLISEGMCGCVLFIFKILVLYSAVLNVCDRSFLPFCIRGLIKNIRDIIYCRKTKASTSCSKLSPSKYDPPDCMQQFQRSFHYSMHVW
jgi:hypothetical protein